LPIEAAEKIRNDFVRFGEPRHGWIGANVSEASEAVEARAPLQKTLWKDTPAAESGMRPGDVVLQIGRTKVREPEDILDASFFLTAGDVVPITVMRGNEKLILMCRRISIRQPAAASTSCRSATLERAMPLNLQSAPERTP